MGDGSLGDAQVDARDHFLRIGPVRVRELRLKLLNLLLKVCDVIFDGPVHDASLSRDGLRHSSAVFGGQMASGGRPPAAARHSGLTAVTPQV